MRPAPERCGRDGKEAGRDKGAPLHFAVHFATIDDRERAKLCPRGYGVTHQGGGNERI